MANRELAVSEAVWFHLHHFNYKWRYMKQDDDHPGLDWAALIKRASSYLGRWELTQSENWKTPPLWVRTILRLKFWEAKLILSSLEFQLFMPNSLPYLLCTTHFKVFNSYRENPRRLHFLRSTSLWITDVLVVKICWLHNGQRGSLENNACPMHNCDPFPPVSHRALYPVHDDAKRGIFRPHIPPEIQPILPALL